MLSDLEVGQFRAFGFIVLRDCLRPKDVERLQKAHDRVIADAPVYDYFGDHGTRMLSPFVQVDDAFSELIEHPGVMEAMRDIWGEECLYIGGSDMWANMDDTPWHTDGRPGREVVALKSTIYLDEQDRDSGALNVIPGSHLPEFSAAIFDSFGCWATATSRPRLRFESYNIPGATAIHTLPGDVVLWDTRLWHSVFRRKDGLPRRTMFISYMPDPGDDLLAISDLRSAIQPHLNEKQPFLFDKGMMSKGGTAREKMAARLEDLGVENVRNHP